jgi:hypothetical protein
MIHFALGMIFAYFLTGIWLALQSPPLEESNAIDHQAGETVPLVVKIIDYTIAILLWPKFIVVY